MPSIEEAIRFHRQRLLVLYRLADSSAACATYEHNDDDEAFWLGVTGIIDDVLSFIQRLKALLPPDILARDVPTQEDMENGRK